ncbi:MAG: TlpA disulfide reductase family protein [Bacteroidota bacterium]
MKQSLLYILMISLLATLSSCDSAQPLKPQTGNWNFSFDLREGAALEVSANLTEAEGIYQLSFDNGGEDIVMDAVTISNDTLRTQFPVFLSYLEGKLVTANEWRGYFYDPSRGPDYKIPFTAQLGEKSTSPTSTAVSLDETWEVLFSPGTEDEYPAIGKFQIASDGTAMGTFLTETGDYRFLHGTFVDSQLSLNTIDGAHLFVFQAKLQADGQLNGSFYSGKHWQEPWSAKVNPEATLRDPDVLTVLNEGYDALSFSFPNMAGDSMRFPNDAYKGKAVVVQILGSWCPNCMDETRLLTQWHQTYHDQGLEIIGLAFERSESTAGVERMKESMGVPYEILLASTTISKRTAAEKLPMLNHVLSYPTSIWIGRDGTIRKIHTGFNGPGTGAPYQQFVTEYQALIEKMLAEEV